MGNPFHLNDEVCARLKSYGCQKYQLSLDGMRETHDWFRKPGSFDCTLEKISCIKRAGIRSVIMTTVSGANIKEVPDIIDTVAEHGADVFAFARYCPTSKEKDTGMTPQEYRELLAHCDEKFKSYEAAGCETYFNKKDHLWTLYEYETGSFKIPEGVEEIPERAFYRCHSLKRVNLPSTVKRIGKEAFAFCGAVTEMQVPEGVQVSERAFCEGRQETKQCITAN